jgi:DNA mismatch endonuclease (patch repair protein)
MPDVFTKKKRSEVMSRIRSRGNRETELALAKLLRKHGITGWRRHVQIIGRDVALRRPRPQYSGRNESATKQKRSELRRRHAARTSQRDVPAFKVRPDFVFRRERVAVFVDGCFWHGCPRHSNLPVNNRPFWRKKLAANRARDLLVTRILRRLGWRVVRVWEHELGKEAWMRRFCRLTRIKADGG